MSQAGSLTGGGSVAPDIETLTGDAGGAVGPDAAFNIDLLGGTGLTTNGVPGSNSITFNVAGGGMTWQRVAGPAVGIANNNGYIPTNAALVTFTLPATASVGDIFEIVGEGAGGWAIAQNAGQSIQYNLNTTTVGVGGSISSTNQYDTVRMVCRATDTTWHVIGNQGLLITA